MKFLIVLFSFFIATLLVACNTKRPSSGNSTYNLLSPVIIKLPAELAEIPGIVYYPKDTAVFAIEDEDGVFYKIYLNKNNEIKKWRFDEKVTKEIRLYGLSGDDKFENRSQFF